MQAHSVEWKRMLELTRFRVQLFESPTGIAQVRHRFTNQVVQARLLRLTTSETRWFRAKVILLQFVATFI